MPVATQAEIDRQAGLANKSTVWPTDENISPSAMLAIAARRAAQSKMRPLPALQMTRAPLKPTNGNASMMLAEPFAPSRLSVSTADVPFPSPDTSSDSSLPGLSPPRGRQNGYGSDGTEGDGGSGACTPRAGSPVDATSHLYRMQELVEHVNPASSQGVQWDGKAVDQMSWTPWDGEIHADH